MRQRQLLKGSRKTSVLQRPSVLKKRPGGQPKPNAWKRKPERLRKLPGGQKRRPRRWKRQPLDQKQVCRQGNRRSQVVHHLRSVRGPRASHQHQDASVSSSLRLMRMGVGGRGARAVARPSVIALLHQCHHHWAGGDRGPGNGHRLGDGRRGWQKRSGSSRRWESTCWQRTEDQLPKGGRDQGSFRGQGADRDLAGDQW